MKPLRLVKDRAFPRSRFSFLKDSTLWGPNGLLVPQLQGDLCMRLVYQSWGQRVSAGETIGSRTHFFHYPFTLGTLFQSMECGGAGRTSSRSGWMWCGRYRIEALWTFLLVRLRLRQGKQGYESTRRVWERDLFHRKRWVRSVQPNCHSDSLLLSANHSASGFVIFLRKFHFIRGVAFKSTS